MTRMKEDGCLTSLILGSILDHIFDPKKDKIFAFYISNNTWKMKHM